MRNLVILTSAVLLGACASPPVPPVVDGSNRQAINSPEIAKIIAAPTHSRTFSVYFPYNSTHLHLSINDSIEMLPLLTKAHRIKIRGRTDGQYPSIADEKIALNRAIAAQQFLVKQGVSPAIISINYISAGDYAADNFSAIGRSLNRRVDIEIFNK